MGPNPHYCALTFSMPIKMRLFALFAYAECHSCWWSLC